MRRTRGDIIRRRRRAVARGGLDFFFAVELDFVAGDFLEGAAPLGVEAASGVCAKGAPAA